MGRVAFLLPQKPGFDPIRVRMRFVVEKVPPGQVFVQVLRCSAVSIIPSKRLTLLRLHVAPTRTTNGGSL